MKRFDYEMKKADRDGKALALAKIATDYLGEMLEHMPDDNWRKEWYAGRYEWCKTLSEELEECTKELHSTTIDTEG